MSSAYQISDFALWRPGYGGAVVTVYVGSTTTKASLYKDEALTIVADNPQVLLSRSDADGTNYGKFEYPIYTAQAYRMDIGGTEETGVVRPPVTSFDGEDASDALVTPTGSSADIAIADLVSRTIFAENYGSIQTGDSGSAATNTTTIGLAIAALSNGGEVILPSGTIKINSFDIPEGVVVCGQGKTATALVSILGDKTITITGASAGLRKLTLDGSNLTAGSVGVYSVGIDEVIFDSVIIKRFETNLYMKGGKKQNWTDFSSENSVDGIKLHGDLDAGDSGDGDDFSDLTWNGGKVSVASGEGLSLSFEDKLCQNMNINAVGFEDCPGTALLVNGAQFGAFNGCWFTGNTNNITIRDDTDVLTPATQENNDVISMRFNGGRMDGGAVVVTGTAQEVIFSSMKLEDVTFTLNTPITNYVYLLDCTEYNVTISGESTKFLRARTTDKGEAFGLTTGNTATKAWSMNLEPGQIVNLSGRVIGKQRNGAGRAVYQIGCGAYRPGATLGYDTQTANYTVGDILTGASSGATARIIADTDSGTTGTLTLTDIQGAFVDNEIITGSSSGSATANGTLSFSNVSLDGVGSVHLRTAYETDASWNAAFVANGPEVELQVTGATSATVEWTVSVDAVTT